MPRNRMGLFVPVDQDNDSRLAILRGTISGHQTPTPPDERYSVLAPVSATSGTKRGDIQCELLFGQSVSSEMLDAARSGEMTIGIRGESGIAGRLYNQDMGINQVQLPGSFGLYSDWHVAGNFVFNKSDPYPVSGPTTDTGYFGKSRTPVFDSFDSMRFFDEVGETEIDYATVFFPRLFTDGDFLYATAQVKNAVNHTMSIQLFRFDSYTKTFWKRSTITSLERLLGEPRDAPSLVTRANFALYNASSSCSVLEDFDKRFICAFIEISAENPTQFKLAIYSSDDRGINWNRISTLGYDSFHKFLEDKLPLGDFYLKSTSNGHDMLIVYDAASNTNPSLRTTRWVRSLDGGQTWQIGLEDLASIFVANDDYANGVLIDSTPISYGENFGLTTDERGRFLLAKIGNGETVDQNGLNGAQYLEIVMASGNEMLEWQKVGSININIDFNAQIDGFGTNGTNCEKYLEDVALFSDHVNGWNYALLKIKTDNAETALENDHIAVICRFRVFAKEEWTVAPDVYYSCGLMRSRIADHFVIMEPPNRNMAWWAPLDSTFDALVTMGGIVFRGHIFICGAADAVTTDSSGFYPYMVSMKPWTNMPVNYTMRTCYTPITSDGDPTNQGWALTSVGAIFTNIYTPSENSTAIDMPGPFVVGGADLRYWEGNTPDGGDYVGNSIGREEYVFRCTFKKDLTDASRIIRIVDIENSYTAVAGVRTSRMIASVNDTSVLFTDNPATPSLWSYAISNDTWYEFMFIRKAATYSIWIRPLNDETNSKISQPWIYVASSPAAFDAGAWTGGTYPSVKFGVVTATAGAYANTTTISFKNITCSRSRDDLKPSVLSILRESGATYQPLIDGGVLSSEREWGYNAPTASDSIRLSVRGEYISPKPIWIGTDFQAVAPSVEATESSCVFCFDFIGDKFLRSSVANGLPLVYGTANQPTQAEPKGAYFDNSVDRHLEIFKSDDYNPLFAEKFGAVSFWCKGSASTFHILENADSAVATNGIFIKFFGSTNKVYITIGGVTYMSLGVFTETESEWLHCAIVLKEDNKLYFYHNGEPAGVSTVVAVPYHSGDGIFEVVQFTAGVPATLGNLSWFSEPIDEELIWKMVLGGPYGPYTASDAFARFFGADARFADTYLIEPNEYGASPNNVLDSDGSSYISSRDGIGGPAPGGTGYGDGDVELIICREDGGYINASHIALFDCNATDVSVWAQNVDPRTFGGWGTFLNSATFHHRDDDAGYPLNIISRSLHPVVAGSVSNTHDQQWVPGAYNGRRLHIMPTHELVHSGVSAADNAIDRGLYNDGDTLRLESGASYASTTDTFVIRELSDKLVVDLNNTSSYKYIRVVLTNNAANGNNIQCGLIRLGRLLEFEYNPNIAFQVEDVSSENSSSAFGIKKVTPYGKVKRQFKLTFDMLDQRHDDFNTIMQAIRNGVTSGDGVFLVTGFYESDEQSTLIYRCRPQDKIGVSQHQFPRVSIDLSLEEM